MDGRKFAALILIVAGAFALGFGVFTYTDAARQIDADSSFMSMEQKHAGIPMWAGIGAMLVGGLLLSLRRKA